MAAAHSASKILIVDDDEDQCILLARRLSVRRYEVMTAASGEEGLALAAHHQPDLVLLDLIMPDGISGIETLSRLRRVQGPSELPVMMLTADDSRNDMLSAIREGANDYLTKPVDFEILLARIAVQLNVRESFRRSISEHARLQRRLNTRARLEEMGLGDPQKRTYMANELLRGLSTGQVKLVYQPQLGIRNKEVASAEALMRWDHPTLGRVPADQFISIAEETGEIGALTRWAIARAVDDHDRFAEAGRRVRIAVNLSAALAADGDFTDVVLEQLQGKTHAISLELTESAIFEDPARAIQNLVRFSEAGVRLSIDDYGTGMSSLSYIQSLPVQELKIDRMFVSKLTSSHRDPLLVRSTIDLAHALDFEVVAEGVEDADTLALLKAMGCDVAQGYFIGAPMPVENLLAYLSDEARLHSLNESFDERAIMARLMTAHQR